MVRHSYQWWLPYQVCLAEQSVTFILTCFTQPEKKRLRLAIVLLHIYSLVPYWCPHWLIDCCLYWVDLLRLECATSGATMHGSQAEVRSILAIVPNYTRFCTLPMSELLDTATIVCDMVTLKQICIKMTQRCLHINYSLIFQWHLVTHLISYWHFSLKVFSWCLW